MSIVLNVIVLVTVTVDHGGDVTSKSGDGDGPFPPIVTTTT